MRRVPLIVLFALIVLTPFILPRVTRSVISPPAPPLPGAAFPLPSVKPPGAISPMPVTDRVAAVRKRYHEAKSDRDQAEQPRRVRPR